MNYSLWNQFENFINGDYEKCFSPVSLLPYLSLKHNFQYENILNELSDEYCFKNISLSNTSEIINDLYSKSKIINENVFKFVMHEVIDNIFEHSQFTQAFALAKSCVNIADYCFLDNGISIQNSFENKNFNLKMIVMQF